METKEIIDNWTDNLELMNQEMQSDELDNSEMFFAESINISQISNVAGYEE